jgi:hypothetical protein
MLVPPFDFARPSPGPDVLDLRPLAVHCHASLGKLYWCAGTGEGALHHSTRHKRISAEH